MTILPSSSYQRACNIHMQIHSLLCFIFKNSPKNKIYQYLQIPLISPFNSRLTKSHCLGIEHISTFRRTSSVQELSWLNWIFDGRKWSTKRLWDSIYSIDYRSNIYGKRFSHLARGHMLSVVVLSFVVWQGIFNFLSNFDQLDKFLLNCIYCTNV